MCSNRFLKTLVNTQCYFLMKKRTMSQMTKKKFYIITYIRWRWKILNKICSNFRSQWIAGMSRRDRLYCVEQTVMELSALMSSDLCLLFATNGSLLVWHHRQDPLSVSYYINTFINSCCFSRLSLCLLLTYLFVCHPHRHLFIHPWLYHAFSFS